MTRLSRSIGIALALATVAFAIPARAHFASSVIDETGSFSFVSPSVGWLLTQRWNANRGSGGPFVVRRTTDGGLRWRRIPSLPVFQGAQILFADTVDGWVYGTRLYSTHDGGRTWHRLTLRGSQTTIILTGSSVWRLDSTCATPVRNCRFTLLASTAGSTTWRVVSRPPLSPSIGSSIARVGLDDAWITGAVSRSANRMRLALVATSDAGQTWRRLPMPCNRDGFGAFYADVATNTASDVWLVCASQPGAGSQAKAVYRSANGGHSWRLVARSPVFGSTRGVTGSLTAAGYLNNTAVTSSRVAFMTLGRDTLIRTTDGGRTWRSAIPVSVSDPEGGGVGPVEFVDPLHGWLLSFPSLLFRTTDGGRTWRKIDLL